MMLDKDFCETLKEFYGEQVFTACFQIATYDFHENVVDCKCRDLACHAYFDKVRAKLGLGDIWICFCKSTSTQGIPS